VEEELRRQQQADDNGSDNLDDDDDSFVDPQSSGFDENFGRLFDKQDGSVILYQKRSICACLDSCTMKGAPLSQYLRCEACGYAAHLSCQKKLQPSLPGLTKNQICKGCVRSLGLLPADLNDKSRSLFISSNDDSLRQFVGQ
jgi:hypothetical protein